MRKYPVKKKRETKELMRHVVGLNNVSSGFSVYMLSGKVCN